MRAPSLSRRSEVDSPRSRRARLAATAFAILTTGCVHATPLILETPDPVARAVDDGRWIQSYPVLLASVRRAIELELGEDLPPFQVALHTTAAAFSGALEAKGHDGAFARDTARAMDGIGGPGWILLNGPAVEALDWPGRTAMIAHEVVHVVQYEWAGGRRGASHQWLREGFAEWLTSRVLLRLQLASESQIRQSLDRARRDVARNGPPRLPALRTFPDWLRWVGSRADGVPYQFAVLAADYLVARHGLSTLVQYFRAFATRRDGDAVFRELFHQSVEEFDAELRGWIRSDRDR